MKDTNRVVVGNTRTKKLHYPGCRWVRKGKFWKDFSYKHAKELIGEGWKTCTVCSKKNPKKASTKTSPKVDKPSKTSTKALRDCKVCGGGDVRGATVMHNTACRYVKRKVNKRQEKHTTKVETVQDKVKDTLSKIDTQKLIQDYLKRNGATRVEPGIARGAYTAVPFENIPAGGRMVS